MSTMLNLALPHVNILSKVDLIEQYGSLAFDLEFYTQVQDLSYLLKKEELHDSSNSDNDDNDNDTSCDHHSNCNHEHHNKSTNKTADNVNNNNNNNEDNENEDNEEQQPMASNNKFTLLHEALIQLIEDYNHVQFLTLDIQDKKSVYKVLQAIDKANGYVFGIMGETRFLIQQEQKLLQDDDAEDD